MLLADTGADVVHIARPGRANRLSGSTLRGRGVVRLDLSQLAEKDVALQLASRADVLLEGNRPGVMERRGLGPVPCLAANPRLVYGRMTSWGQEGPLAGSAGHDINYIALSGALHAIGPAGGAPIPPLNLMGDCGGGAMFLGFGVLCALLAARHGGMGQVVGGVASLMALSCDLRARGSWTDRRGERALDSGVPWYATYPTADDRYVAVGAIEEPFWRELLARLGIPAKSLPVLDDQSGWPGIRTRLAAVFLTRRREEWDELPGTTDLCVSPVLDLAEAMKHPHVATRGSFLHVDGVFTSMVPCSQLSPRASAAPLDGCAPAGLGQRWRRRSFGVGRVGHCSAGGASVAAIFPG
jgi:alpha-methylacyl-CoA racemase